MNSQTASKMGYAISERVGGSAAFAAKDQGKGVFIFSCLHRFYTFKAGRGGCNFHLEAQCEVYFVQLQIFVVICYTLYRHDWFSLKHYNSLLLIR